MPNVKPIFIYKDAKPYNRANLKNNLVWFIKECVDRQDAWQKRTQAKFQ